MIRLSPNSAETLVLSGNYNVCPEHNKCNSIIGGHISPELGKNYARNIMNNKEKKP